MFKTRKHLIKMNLKQLYSLFFMLLLTIPIT